jgi:hypothetical protein
MNLLVANEPSWERTWLRWGSLQAYVGATETPVRDGARDVVKCFASQVDVAAVWAESLIVQI